MIVDWLNANEKNENINHKLIKQKFLGDCKINIKYLKIFFRIINK